MNKEILRKNIEDVIMQPCKGSSWSKSCKEIKMDGLSDDGTHIMVKVTPDDTSWKCDLVDKDGNPIDYVERILEQLPILFTNHLVTLKHDDWISYSYVPVFDTDIQQVWNRMLSDFLKEKQEWCDRYGCE